MEEVNKYAVIAWDLVLNYGPKLLLALVTLIIGLWVIGMFTRSFRKILISREVDPSLIPFSTSLLSTSLKVLLVLSILSMVGIEVTSFIAILGAASFAVGLALQGSLQNFAGGVMILIFKPFKVGDYIDGGGHAGTVKAIQIFNTILKTPDNKTIIIPNGGLSTGSLINYSTEPTRRLDMVFGIGYGDDIDKAIGILQEMAKADERVQQDPAPFTGVVALGDSSVNIAFRVWCDSAEYWNLHFYFHENVKKRFDKEGISIPFPQTEVTLVK
jgi:small conductance mechanosensitive channel